MMYWQKAINVIPVRADKSPAVASWRHWVTEEQTQEEVAALFAEPCYGIAAIMGWRKLAAIDVDEKYFLHDGTVFEALRKAMADNGMPIEDFAIQKTPSGGYHIIYSALADVDPRYEKNTKLSGRWQTLEELAEYNRQSTKPVLSAAAAPPLWHLETRAGAGYIVVAPTPGYSMWNKPLYEVRVLSGAEVAKLWRIAASLDERDNYYDADERLYGTLRSEKQAWKWYNERMDAREVVSLLEGYGWVSVREDALRYYLRRPGKDRGTSANIHKLYATLRVWSSNTAFDTDKAYSPFGVYAQLTCGGDLQQAARELFRQFGGKAKVSAPAPTPGVLPTPEAEATDTYLQDLLRSAKVDEQLLDTMIAERRYRRGENPPAPRFVWNYISRSGHRYPIAAGGMIVAMVGRQKSRKTSLLAVTMSAALHNRTYLGMEVALDDDELILWFDTEQGMVYFYRTCDMVVGQRPDTDERFIAINMRPFSKPARSAAIWMECLRYKDRLRYVIIDGAADLCHNFNDEVAAWETMEFLMRLSSMSSAVVIPVLHLTKDRGFLRGHFGTFLQEKADAVIEVQYDRKTALSRVICRDSRGERFPDFYFKHGDLGTLVEVDNPEAAALGRFEDL